MAKQNLKQSAKARAQSAVKRATSRKPASTTSPAKTVAATPSIVSSTPASAFKFADSNSNKSIAVTVPGLTPISPDQIASLLLSFTPDSYRIVDPLSPPESLPQVNEADFEKGMTIYQGTQRALKLTGAAFDTTRERFVTIGKQVKAFGAGIQTATEFERVKGNYFNYLNQLETNEQKSINLNVSQHKTTVDRSIATSNKNEISEKQKQAEISTQKATDETAQKQAQLDEFRKQLGTK